MRWQLDQALELIRLLQPETRKFGFHLTLGGGVLNTGQSEKDLDLYFLPLCNKSCKVDPDGMLKYLQMLWGEGEPIQPGRSVVVDNNGFVDAERPEYEDNPEGTFYKFRQKFFFGGNQRIDAFILAYDETVSASGEVTDAISSEPGESISFQGIPFHAVSNVGAEYWGINREPPSSPYNTYIWPDDPRNRFNDAARERQRQEQINTYERMRNYINETMPISWDVETPQPASSNPADPDPGDSDDSPF